MHTFLNFRNLLLATPILVMPAHANTVKQPNILLIITDDQGIGDFGFINPLVKTPNIDRLASQSAVLTNFTACPASSPSRVSLYTGRNHLLTGVWGVPPRSNVHTDEVFAPQFFKAAGYSTLLLGKRDCTQAVGCEPWEYGWDDGFTVTGYQQKDPRMGTKQGMISKKGYTSEIMSEEAIRFIESTKDQPWFVSLNYITPHMPWICSPEFAEPYKKEGYSDNLAACWGAITQMDAALGKVLEQIRKQGSEEQTIVILYSDNGATGPEVQKLAGRKEQEVPGEDWKKRNALNLRAYKSSTYQNGVRVPLLIKYPKVIETGERSQFARVEDVLPTLLDLTGVSNKSRNHQPFSGVSIKANLINKQIKVEVPAAFRINIAHEGAPRTRKGIIEKPSELKLEDHHLSLQNEKYVFHTLPGGQSELYDLQNDPNEKINIADQFPDITEKMAVECRGQWETVIQSGRAFRMPALQIGRIQWDGKPLSQNVFSAGYVQKLNGDVNQMAQELQGFALVGDAAHYKLDVVTPAKYYVFIKGKDLDKCGELTLMMGDKSLIGQLTPNGVVSFGAIDLQKTNNQLIVKSSASSDSNSKATISQLIFSRNNNAGTQK
jgi:arylsulfatase A-like enzyme